MALRLDPRIPVLWRDPTTVQLGLDHPSAVLEGMGPAEEAMLAALRVGIGESGLALIAREHGADEAAARSLIRRIRAALADAVCTERPTVLLVGEGVLADRVATALADGATVVRAPQAAADAAEVACTLVVLVVDWIVPLELMGRWLRRDVPHLPVIASDDSVTVGPLIEPGVGPCLYCRHRALADDDPAWPTLAIQLAALPAPTLPAAVQFDAAAEVARVAATWTSGPVHHSTAIDAATGARRAREWRRHPECACDDALTAPAGTGSAAAASPELPRRRTTTATPTVELA